MTERWKMVFADVVLHNRRYDGIPPIMRQDRTQDMNSLVLASLALGLGVRAGEIIAMMPLCFVVHRRLVVYWRWDILDIT
jgi:hypothetical protein